MELFEKVIVDVKTEKKVAFSDENVYVWSMPQCVRCGGKVGLGSMVCERVNV